MTWSVANYNANPNLNTAINGIDISEGSSAAGYNDALRQIMADIEAWTAAYAVTYPIDIAHGGTGQTTAPAALTALNGLDVKYQHLPQTVESSNWTYVTTMDGGHVRFTGGSASSAGIAVNATQNFPIGATVLTINDGAGAVSIVPAGGVTLVWAATAGTGSRQLAPGGMALMVQVASDRWFISGTGLT